MAFSVAVLLVGAVLLEFASRWLFPVAPGIQFYDSSGVPVEIKEGALLRLKPNLTFRQVSPDFDAVGHVGPEGYRAPSAGARGPEVIFLGDSFTFGQGLTDDEAFPAIACAHLMIRCANLGYPGTGTARQVAILERHLQGNQWHPREVKLFVFAMAGSLGAGNDFFDTVEEVRASGTATPAAPTAGAAPGGTGPLDWVMGIRTSVLAKSNLARIAFLFLGPSLRSWLSPAVAYGQLDEGVVAMAQELDRFRSLSEKYGFATSVYVLHPVQDLLRGTQTDTSAAVQRAARDMPVTDMSAPLMDDPRAYYFPYDGHFNPAGARRIAEAIVTSERAMGR